MDIIGKLMDGNEYQMHMDTMLQNLVGVTIFDPQAMDFWMEDVTQLVLLCHMTTNLVNAIFCGFVIVGIICEVNGGWQWCPFWFVIGGAHNCSQSVRFLALFPCPITSCLMLVPVFSVVILSQG